MSILSMHTASSGLEALSTEIDVIANNLANVNTNGFKRSRVNFEDLLYQVKDVPGGQNSQGVVKPTGTFVGLGTRVSNTQLVQTQGSPLQTSSPTDMTINGEGFFRVEYLDDLGEGFAYTRSGNFIKNRDGDLVLANSDGYRLDPPVNVPDGATQVSVGPDGAVKALMPGEQVAQEIGIVSLYRFPNATGLAQSGKNLFLGTEASGESFEGQPGEAGFGTVIGGFIEGSNVDAVNELIGLIKTQRAFELNSQVITTSNEMLQTVTRLK